MRQVTIILHQVLAELMGGQRRYEVEATSVLGALEALCETHPQMRVHLFNETGAVRQHIICLVDETYVRARDVPGAELGNATELRIVNAFSGG